MSDTQDNGSQVPNDIVAKVRAEVLSKVVGWIVGAIVLLGGFAFTGWWLFLTEKIDAYIAGKVASIPRAAVVAFDAREKCPTGWNDFDDAKGRVIIGSGSPQDGVRAKAFAERKGSDSVKLIAENLPEHHHETVIASQSSDGAAKEWGYGSTRQAIWGAAANPLTTANTGPAGQKDPVAVEILPPYIALRFCKQS